MVCVVLKNKKQLKIGFDKEAAEMDTRTMKTILEIGETIAVEFKRYGKKFY